MADDQQSEESQLLLVLPDYFEEVVRRLQGCDWIVHNFNSDTPSELYNPAAYSYNVMLEGFEYRAHLDLNVLQYVVNCVKKERPNDHYRDACAMLLFCRMSQILLEPNLALYERVNHRGGDVEEAVNDLSILRALDTAEPELLAEYMLGDRTSLREVAPAQVDRAEIVDALTRYERLRHWDSIYVLVLGAVATYWNRHVQPTERLGTYLDWVVSQFRISLPCITYAVRLFGKAPLANMMKYRRSDPPATKRAALANMTWDLFAMDHYLREWTDPGKPWHSILFTQDKVLRSLLRLVIEVQRKEGMEPLLRHLNAAQAAACGALIGETRNERPRVYGTENWTPEHRSDLIRRLEYELLDDSREDASGS